MRARFFLRISASFGARHLSRNFTRGRRNRKPTRITRNLSRKPDSIMNATSIAWRLPGRNEVKTLLCLPSWMENSIGKKSPPSQRKTEPRQKHVGANFYTFRAVGQQVKFPFV